MNETKNIIGGYIEDTTELLNQFKFDLNTLKVELASLPDTDDCLNLEQMVLLKRSLERINKKFRIKGF